MKKEAYKIYYQQNKERILQRTRDRCQALREHLDENGTEADFQALRQKYHHQYIQRKTKDMASVLQTEANRIGGYYGDLFNRIVKSPHIDSITQHTLVFLLRLSQSEPIEDGRTATHTTPAEKPTEYPEIKDSSDSSDSSEKPKTKTTLRERAARTEKEALDSHND